MLGSFEQVFDLFARLFLSPADVSIINPTTDILVRFIIDFGISLPFRYKKIAQKIASIEAIRGLEELGIRLLLLLLVVGSVSPGLLLWG